MYSAINKTDFRDYTLKLGNSENLVWKCFKDIIYNQKEVSNYSCTTHAACGVFSDVTGLKLSEKTRNAIWKKQLDTGADSNIWDTFQNWMKQTIKVLNTIFDEEYKYYREKLTEESIKSIIDFWSSIMTGYQWKLRADSQDNWIIDINDHEGNGGHCIRIVKYFYENNIFCIKYVDNYQGFYTFNVITYKDFMKNKDFFEYGYFIKSTR